MFLDRAGVLLVASVLGALALGAGGASAAAWLPQDNASVVNPSGSVALADVAMDGQGNAVAAWARGVDGLPEIIQASTRPAGGGWTRPVDLSYAGEDTLSVKVAANAEGDAAVVWVGIAGGGRQIVRVATLPAGGDEWSEPRALSDVDGYASRPDVAIDAEGAVTAIWIHRNDEFNRVIHAAIRPVDGDWSRPVALTDDREDADWPQVAVDSQGNATAVWTFVMRSDDGIIQSKTRSATGEWSSETVNLSAEDGLAKEPRIVIDGQGDATAIWHRYLTPRANNVIQFVQTAQRADGAWSAPETISRDEVWLANKPELTVDPAGNVTAIWVSRGDETRTLQTRYRPVGRAWESPIDLMTAVNQVLVSGESDAQVVADSHGDVTAIWTAWPTQATPVVRSRHRMGGAWSQEVTLSVSNGYSLWPEVAVDPQGHATVVWSGSQGGTHAVRSRVLDPVAPLLNEVTVPERGVVGQPVAMSVDPFDVWLPVLTSWDFGDGDSGPGDAVSHCYSTPGERTVTVSGMDLAANAATSERRTIEIEDDPSLPEGEEPCPAPRPDPDPDPGSGPGPDPGSGPGPGPDPGPGLTPIADPDPDPDPGPTPTPGPGPRPGPRPSPVVSPVLSSLKQSSSRWRVQASKRKPRLPVGTTFRFRLDRAAAVRLAFSQQVTGRRVKGRCVKPTKANRKKPRCTRYESSGTVSIRGKSGSNSFKFRGKVGKRTLKPGRYRLSVTARADGRTSKASTITFTIVH